MSDEQGDRPGARHGRGTTEDADPGAVVDYSHLTPGELRARVRDMQDGHEAQIVAAREELVESIARFREGVRELRSAVVDRLRDAVPVAAGAAAAGVVLVVLVRVVMR